MTECESGFEILDPDFGLRAVGADESERKDVDRRSTVIEEAFVAVADLFDVERSEGELSAMATLVQRLERVEQVEHGPVIYR